MKVLIFQEEEQIYKIEIYGHLQSILCAGFSGAFNFLYGCIMTIDNNTIVLSTKQDGNDLRVLTGYKSTEKIDWLLSEFKDYCLMMKDQFKLDVEVINEGNKN